MWIFLCQLMHLTSPSTCCFTKYAGCLLSAVFCQVMLEVASKFRGDEHRMTHKQYDLVSIISSGNQTTFFEGRVKSQISKRAQRI